MSIEAVRKHLKKWNAQHRIIEFDTSSATVELAALALKCEPKRIAKSLAFKIEDRAILIVTAGDAKVSSSKYKKEFKHKPKMLAPYEVIELVGHEVGGVCPFGVKENVKIYLDISLKRFDTVFPACGNSNSAIEITIEELEEYVDYVEWVDVCKDWY